MIKLYVDAQYASPYALSVFVALTELNVPFELVTIDLSRSENLKPEFRHLSLTARVPVLCHGDFCLSESSAITEYINDCFQGTNLYPKNVQEKARARQIQAWLRSDLMPIRQERSTEVVFYKPVATPLSVEALACAQKLFEVANSLLSDGKDNLFDDWCIADVDLALMLNRLILNGDEVPARLIKYANTQWSRPSVQKWVNQDRLSFSSKP